MAKRYEEIQEKVRRQLRVIMGNGYSLTPAILKKKNGNKCEVYFAYRISGEGDISRPYIRVVTDYETGVVLEFQNAYYHEFADNSRFPLDSRLELKVPTAKTAAQQKELVKQLCLLHEKVREFAYSESLSQEERKTLTKYRECFRDTVPAELMVFCADTEKEFFEWMDRLL